MTALSTGQDEIIAESKVTISNPDTPFTPALATYKNQAFTYNIRKCKYNIISNIKGCENLSQIFIWSSEVRYYLNLINKHYK